MVMVSEKTMIVFVPCNRSKMVVFLRTNDRLLFLRTLHSDCVPQKPCKLFFLVTAAGRLRFSEKTMRVVVPTAKKTAARWLWFLSTTWFLRNHSGFCGREALRLELINVKVSYWQKIW
jgi:hypothetical protein